VAGNVGAGVFGVESQQRLGDLPLSRPLGDLR
jgi:hypothetical protein